MKHYLYIFLFLTIIIFGSNSVFTSGNFEFLNRRIYSFNRGIDQFFLNPCTSTYINVFPAFIKSRFNDFFNNLFDIQNLFFSFYFYSYSDFLNNLNKVLINSSFGFFGFFNLTHSFDFKYTSIFLTSNLFFFYFFINRYIVLPIIGPASVYNNLNLCFLQIFNPFIYIFSNIYFFYFIDIINKKSCFFFDINFFHENMLDGYSFLKDLYFQHFYIFS